MYLAIVEQEEGSAFGVRFPDVPGCFSAADVETDVLANAVQALSMHLEGVEAPEARGLGELRKDAEVCEAM